MGIASEKRRNECSCGIHFFITRQEAGGPVLMIIANMAIQIAKTVDYLMTNVSTYEERENAFNRMLKISQSCTLSLVDIIDTIYGYVLAGHGSVDDALRNLERRYL